MVSGWDSAFFHSQDLRFYKLYSMAKKKKAQLLKNYILFEVLDYSFGENNIYIFKNLIDSGIGFLFIAYFFIIS